MTIVTRVDQLLQSNDPAAPADAQAYPQMADRAAALQLDPQLLADAADELDTDPIHVAGLGKVLRNIARKGREALDGTPATPAPAIAPAAEKAKPIFPTPQPPVTVPRQPQVVEKLITPKAAQDAASQTAARIAADAPAYGKPPEELFNTIRTGLPDDANTFMDEVAHAAGVRVPTRVTHAEILSDLQEMGYKPKDLDWITNYSDDTEQMRKVAMAREVLVSTAKMTQQLAKQLTDMPTPELAARYHQATVLLGQVSRGVKGIQTDYARALGVMRATPEGDATALIQFVDDIGGIDDVVAHAGKLAKLDMSNIANAKRAADLAEVSIATKAKNIWVTTWINGLLSSPVTHAKNILGNELFAAIQIPERGVAAVIGKMRGADVGDRVEIDEAVAMMRGLVGSQIKALDAFATSFVDNAPVTGTLTKMGDAGATVTNFGDYLGIGGMMGRAANLYGKAVTLPGRALMAEDEFFKTQGYFMQLPALATRRAALVRQQALDAGKTLDEAQALERQAYVDILDNPPAELNADAWDFSRQITFTQDLERGSIGQRAQQLATENLVFRIVMPFIRTPVNIATETLERTPFAPFMRSWRDAYNAGGIQRDMALAKAATGTSLLTVGGFMASSGRITGAGPSEPGQREALKNSGWQPYSMVFFKDELDGEARELLNTYGRITETNDKVFWSYQGIEPLGGILALAANYADYARYEDNVDLVEQVGMGAAFGLAQYTMELPYLQGMAEFVKTMTGGGGAQITPDKVKGMVNQLAKSGTMFLIGGSPAGAWSSAQATAERFMDPTASNTTAPPGTTVGLRGVLEAVNTYMSRVPGLSASLPPVTNRWGEVVEYGEGAIYETVSPIRVKKGQQKAVDRLWLDYDMPRGQPDRNVSWSGNSEMSGIRVELTPEQFNELKAIYGSSGVQEHLVQEANDPAFDRLSIRDKQQVLRALDDRYMTRARSILVNE